MRCIVLLRVTLNDEVLTLLVLLKREYNRTIVRNSDGMIASMKYFCQDKAWVYESVFKHGIMQIWTPFAPMKDSPAYLLMDEFLVHTMSSYCNEIKD